MIGRSRRFHGALSIVIGVFFFFLFPVGRDLGERGTSFCLCLAWDGCFVLLGNRSGHYTILHFFIRYIDIYWMLAFVAEPIKTRWSKSCPRYQVRLSTDNTCLH